MGNEKKLDSETSSKLQEKGKYYKKIEILEAVVLGKEKGAEGEKEVYIKDFSSYFDVKIEKVDGLKEEIVEYIEDFLSKKFKRLDQYWKVEEKTNILNDRIYKLDFNKIESNKKNKLEEVLNELKVLLKDKFNKNINYDLENKLIVVNSKNINFSDIKRVFNIKSFFQDHESLFSQDNDFEEPDKQALYLNIKDSNDKTLENLETKIFNLPNENKFFVEVLLDSETDLEGQKIEISGEKKYDYVFFTERGEYLKGSLKNN